MIPPSSSYLALVGDSISLVNGGSPTVYTMSQFESDAGISVVWPIPAPMKMKVQLKEVGNVTLPAEVFPSHVVGAVTGFGGMFGSLASAFSQKAIGWTAQNLSFAPIFAVGSVMHLTGFVLVCLLVGELGQVRDVSGPDSRPAAPAVT